MQNEEKVITLKWNNSSFSAEQSIMFHFWQCGKVALHSHDYFELFLITEGPVLHEWNGTEKLLEKGTLCLIKPCDAHAFTPCANTPTVHFNLKLKKELMESLCETVSPTLYNSVLEADRLIKYKLKPHEYEYFKKAVENANYSPAHKTNKSAIPLMKTLAVNFLFYVHQSLKTKKKNHPKWFEDFLETLQTPENLSKPLSELYGLSGYSQTRLNSYFHQYTGTTLVAYLTQKKVNYACNLLRSTNYTILQISLTAGFRNLSRFNAVFKKTTGETPTNYRKQFIRPTP